MRVNSIVNAAARAETADKLNRLVDAPIRNVIGSFNDDYVKANADFRSKAGLKCHIIRKSGGACCEWCSNLAGKYEYGKEPQDIYRRHDKCTCSLIYVNDKGFRQVVWKPSDEELERMKSIDTPLTKRTRAEAEEFDRQLKKRVDISGKSGIIKLEDIRIEKSVGAKAKNYSVMDLNTGEQFHFAEGSRIEKVKVFAGKGSKSVYRKAYVYADKYGGNAEDWQHVKGLGVIDYYGEERRAEVHWSRHETYGNHDFFVKEWLE